MRDADSCVWSLSTCCGCTAGREWAEAFFYLNLSDKSDRICQCEVILVLRVFGTAEGSSAAYEDEC